MQIENDRVLVAIAQDESNPCFIECYPISSIMALQDVAGVTLSGHPGKDFEHLEGEQPLAFAVEATRHQARQVNDWVSRGLFIAVGYLRSNKGKRLKLDLSWRKPEKYLSPDQMMWLRAYQESSFQFANERDACLEIGQGLQKLARLKGKKVKRKKVKAKVRRRREREVDYETG